MKQIIRILTSVIIALLVCTPALAADVTDARYSGIIRVTNAGDEATNVSTVFTLSAANLISAGYLAEDFSNIAVMYGATSVGFMPGHGANPFAVFVPSINGPSVSQDLRIYTGGETAMNGKLAYFPGNSGMSWADDADLELGDNFAIEQKGYFNTSSGDDKYSMLKEDAFGIDAGIAAVGAVTARIYDTTTVKDSNTTAPTPNPFSGTTWRAQTFIPSSDYRIGAVSLLLSKSGTPSGNLNVSIRATDGGGGPSGTDLASGNILANSVSNGYNYVTLNQTAVLSSGTRYAIVFSCPDGDFGALNYLSNYVASTDPYAGGVVWWSNDSGDSWSVIGGYEGYDTGFKTHPTVVVSAEVDPGDHTVRVSADGTQLNLYVDGVFTDSDPLNGLSVPNNANNWSACLNNAMPYLEYQKIWVSGTLQQHITWENDTTFSDLSGNDHDVTPTLRTTSTDEDVTAALVSFSPVSESIATDVLPGGDTSGPISSLPTEPTGMYRDDEAGNISLPGAALVNDLLDASSTPYAFFWLPICGFIIIMCSYWAYRMSPSLLVKGSANWFLYFLFAAVNVWGFWVFALYFIGSWAIIAHSRSSGL